MVLRIPTADFDDAMSELEKVATLVSSKRQSADVTTQVLDIDVRVEAQQRSIDRIQVLFDHATSIKDIVSIEGELSRRQADLASLRRSSATSPTRPRCRRSRSRSSGLPRRPSPEPEDHDDAGFLSGLSDGWGALKTFLVARLDRGRRAAAVAGA